MKGVAKFTPAESAVAYNAAVLWKTAPIEVIKTRKRKVKIIASAKTSKGYVKGTSGFAKGYPG
jgi:hypothetical protein